MKRLFSSSLVLLLHFGIFHWIRAAQKMAVLEGDNLTRKIYESITEVSPYLYFIYLPEKVNYKILSLQLNQSNIDSISKKDFGNVTDLVNINLQQNNIDVINSDAFSNFVRLRKVDLSRNNIKIIQSELFQHNVCILMLDLSFNSIEAIGEQALVNLTQLEHLFLNENPLKQLEADIISGNRRLKFLQLSKVQLQHVDERIFQKMTNLSVLYLHENNIVNISEHLFQNNTNLSRLILKGNKIIDVSKMVFKNLYNVTVFEIGANNISELNDCFWNMSELTKLILSNNRIKVLSPNLFSNNTNLEHLEINNNSITSLPVGLFKNNRRLKKLSLKQNQLTAITNENFQMNVNLAQLFLAKNNISQLDASTFDGMQNLRHLNLQFNAIEDFPIHVFYMVSESLKKLELNNNKLKDIHDDVFSVGMEELHTLNLGHNYLTDCNFYNNYSFPKLRDLHLNNNKLRRVDNLFIDSSEIEMPALKNLYLEFNEIEFVYKDARAVSTIKSFEFLNMSNNKITEFKPYLDVSELIDIIIDVRNNKILRVNTSDSSEVKLRGEMFIWESVIPLKNIILMKSVDYYGHGQVLKIGKYDLTVSAVKKSIEEIQCVDDLIIVSLVIHQNQLKQIDCLSKVWTLHFIDFSYNNLTNLTKKHFAKMIYLETLDISHNHLTALDLKIFAASAKLKEFYFDECEVVFSWQYYQITELFRNLTHTSMQNNSIYCPLLATIIQKFQNANITIKGYKKDDQIVFDSIDGISCEAYKSIKDVLIVVVCSNNFLIVTTIAIVLSIVHRYNKMQNSSLDFRTVIEFKCTETQQNMLYS